MSRLHLSHRRRGGVFSVMLTTWIELESDTAHITMGIVEGYCATDIDFN